MEATKTHWVKLHKFSNVLSLRNEKTTRRNQWHEALPECSTLLRFKTRLYKPHLLPLPESQIRTGSHNHRSTHTTPTRELASTFRPSNTQDLRTFNNSPFRDPRPCQSDLPMQEKLPRSTSPSLADPHHPSQQPQARPEDALL